MADPNLSTLSQEQRQSTRNLEITPTSPAYTPHGDIPNTPLAAATIAFFLGTIFALGLPARLLSGVEAQTWWYTYPLAFFSSSWAVFHYLEFAITAGWNREKCSVDSFLLNNGRMYHIANTFAVLEYLLGLYFLPQWKVYTFVAWAGVFTTIGGQWLRTSAMICASTNFSHSVRFKKAESHSLVTGGVYAYFRHPSYAGFFYWSLGTQLVLQNPLSFVLFFLILWRFFYFRIRVEERVLIRFFGDDYTVYRQQVSTKIPFIP